MINIVTNVKNANCITHSGTMHADEVFVTAFLSLYLGNVNVFRTNQVPEEHNAIVYDIGREEFDHHQETAKIRKNGIKYSSIGLLWKRFGKEYLKNIKMDNTKEVFNYIDKDLIEQIDAIDNGIFPDINSNYRVKTLSDIISLFNPRTFNNEDENTQFIKACNLATIIFQEEVLYAQNKVKSYKIIKEKIENNKNHYIILDEYIPYEECILSEEKGKDIYFVIFPSNRGGYGIKTIPISKNNHDLRIPFPKEWGGKEKEELQKIANKKDIEFCHANLFYATTNTKECAIEIVEELINREVNNE